MYNGYLVPIITRASILGMRRVTGEEVRSLAPPFYDYLLVSASIELMVSSPLWYCGRGCSIHPIGSMEKDIEKRWEAGAPHHKHSLALVRELKRYNDLNGSPVDLRTGGDGDPGEDLLYLLDMYYEEYEEKLDKVISTSDRCGHGHLKCKKC